MKYQLLIDLISIILVTTIKVNAKKGEIIMKNNKEIREALKAAGLKQWKLGELLGCSESTVYRKLRKELPEDEKQKILKMINDSRK